MPLALLLGQTELAELVLSRLQSESFRSLLRAGNEVCLYVTVWLQGRPPIPQLRPLSRRARVDEAQRLLVLLQKGPMLIRPWEPEEEPSPS